MSNGVVGSMPNYPVPQARGFDAQVKAALFNIDNFDERPHQDRIPTVILADGSKVDARMPTETARERGQLHLDTLPDEQVRRAEQRIPRNAIYSLKRPGRATATLPNELIVVPVGYDFQRGMAIVHCMCLGLPGYCHATGSLGSAGRPLSIPADADLEDVTDEARAMGTAWGTRTFPYRAWLATLAK